MKSLTMLSAAAVFALVGTSTSGATAYHFTMTGTGINASGVITVDETVPFANPYPCGTCATAPGYLVTGVAGFINGDPITGVAPIGWIAANDNLLYPTSNPLLDWGDLGFTTASNDYNVFSGNFAGNPGYFLYVGTGSVFDHPVDFVLSADAPEPATWALMLGGFGLIGGVLRNRRVAKVSFVA